MKDLCYLSSAYAAWFSKQLYSQKIGEWCSIVIPFFDESRDNFSYLVRRRPDSSIEINDDGSIVSRLLEYVPNVMELYTKKDILHSIISKYHINFSEEHELSLITTEELFPFRFHDLIQASLEISTIRNMTSHNVKQLFKDEVSRFFKNSSIKYSENLKYTGNSGLQHKFDFSIKIDNRIEIIKTIPFIDKKILGYTIFSWNDAKSNMSKQTNFIVLIDDLKKKIPAEYNDALKYNNIIPFQWSEKQKLSNYLKVG